MKIGQIGYFFEERLAWVFAMRRAPGMLDSREMFVLSLKPDGNRTCDPGSIRITRLGKKRALVDCLVKMKDETFHDTRLFILDGDGRWKLLAWRTSANDGVRKTQAAAMMHEQWYWDSVLSHHQSISLFSRSRPK